MKRSLVPLGAALLLGLAACQDSTQPILEEAPELQTSFQVVPNQYIVVFNDEVADAPGLARRLANAQGASLLATYQYAIKGFAFRGSSQAAEEKVQAEQRGAV